MVRAREKQVVVNSLSDEIDGTQDGNVSLREALIVVEDGGQIDIQMEGTLQLEMGQLEINKSVQIVGPGADKLTIRVADKSRIYFIDDAPLASCVPDHESCRWQ